MNAEFVKSRIEITEDGLAWKSFPGATSYWNNMIAGKPLKPTKDLAGNLVVNLDQRKVFLASVVWALNFGEWFDYFEYGDGNPENLSLGNLSPCLSDPTSWLRILSIAEEDLKDKQRVRPTIAAALTRKSREISVLIQKLGTHEVFDPELAADIKTLITKIGEK